MPGMRDVKGWRVAHVGVGTIEWHDTEWNLPVEPDRIMPALDDPATLGCVLELWWQAWPAECDDRARRCAEIQDAIVDIDRDKLARALVAALEAAPREAGR